MVLTFPFVLKLNFACIVVPRDSVLHIHPFKCLVHDKRKC